MTAPLATKPCCAECAHLEVGNVYIGEHPWGGVVSIARCVKRRDESLWEEWADRDCPDFEERPEK